MNIIEKIVTWVTLSGVFSSGLYDVQSTKVGYERKYRPLALYKEISIQQKKRHFCELVLPAVEKVYADLDKQYKETKKVLESGKSNAKIEKLMKSYYVKSPQDLLKRLKPHPKSVALAQAAVESAWATSRFTKVANNLFGIWSFNKDEPRVAASKKRGNKTIYVKKYADVEDSIRDYYKVLATGKAFAEFRDVKMKCDNPYELVKKLDNYSEKGAEYGERLAAVIRHNCFYKLD